MGREIRRVPADWEHPKVTKFNPFRMREEESFQPLNDRPFVEAAREWMDAAIAWDNGTDPDCAEHKAAHPFYWQWSNLPPDPAYYRPEWTSEPLHYQVYETVSEGTPVTPHFATKAELIDYLVEYGDEWDQKRTAYGRQESAGWSRENATAFVEREWAPSMIISAGVIMEPRDGLPMKENTE
jgi:hypothetical protein